MSSDNIYVKLLEPFPRHELEWKPQVTSKKSKEPIMQEGVQVALCMGYINSRHVQDRLNVVVGPENWEDSYRHVSIKYERGQDTVEEQGFECTLTINGVSKRDVGTPSWSEGLKGVYSDSLKRAAVKWGIGRFLYDLEPRWIPYDGYKLTNLEKFELQELVILFERLCSKIENMTDRDRKRTERKYCRSVTNNRANFFEELNPFEAGELIKAFKEKLSE